MFEVWLSYNNGEQKLRLPVPPQEIKITKGNNVNVLNINNVGEIGVIGHGRLANITLTTFFPSQEYSFCQYIGFPTPSECIRMINSWKDSGKPIRLIVTPSDINIACAIESFTYGPQDGTHDIYFELSLIEYRFVKVNAKALATPSNTTVSSNREVKEPAKTYKVKSGDTLWSICKRMLGDGSKYAEVAKKNGIKDPNKIKVGQVIRL